MASSLPPNDGDVRVVFDELVERGLLDAREAADLVGAVPPGEQTPYAERRVGPVPVGSRRGTHIHWVSGKTHINTDN